MAARSYVEEIVAGSPGRVDLVRPRSRPSALLDLRDRPRRTSSQLLVRSPGSRSHRASTPSAKKRVHQLAAEAGHRPEPRHLAPLAARQACLLLELAPGASRGSSPARACRPGARGECPRSPRGAGARGRPGLRGRRRRSSPRPVLDDLPLVVAPALERDGEQLALPGGLRLVGLHPSSLRARLRRRRPRQRTPDPRRVRGPCARAGARRTPRASPHVGLVGDDDVAQAQAEHGLRVVGDAPVALALVGLRDARRDHCPAAERRSPHSRRWRRRARRGRAGSRCRRCRARSRRQRRRARRFAPRRAPTTAFTHSTSPSKQARRRPSGEQSRPRSSRTVSDSAAAARRPASWMYATRSPASAAHTGATWLCSEQHTTGMPSRRRRARRASSTCGTRDLQRRVRQLHHVRAGLAASPRPRVRFAYRTSNPPGAEPELARLRVDDHLVAERDRPGQPGYATQGLTVHLRRTSPSCRSSTAVTGPAGG